MCKDYLGQTLQICGVEEHRLVGGRGDGMRLLEVRNGRGLQFTVSADRCCDLSRLSLDGVNFGFFSASGYVHPAYYDGQGKGSEGSFTGGFLATCGLHNVGAPCMDEGEQLPLHGAVGNLPAEHVLWDVEEDRVWLRGTVPHGGFYAPKLVLTRTLSVSRQKNELTLTDRVRNAGDSVSPLMMLYHINLGYPLLSETAQVYIPSRRVVPRDFRAAEGLAEWSRMAPPQAGFAEQCYFHEFDGPGEAGVYNPVLGKGVSIRFDGGELPKFTQWKMLGCGEYVLGLEPGNCLPNGRADARARGELQFLPPGEERSFTLAMEFYNQPPRWAKEG